MIVVFVSRNLDHLSCMVLNMVAYVKEVEGQSFLQCRYTR